MKGKINWSKGQCGDPDTVLIASALELGAEETSFSRTVSFTIRATPGSLQFAMQDEISVYIISDGGMVLVYFTFCSIRALYKINLSVNILRSCVWSTVYGLGLR